MNKSLLFAFLLFSIKGFSQEPAFNSVLTFGSSYFDNLQGLAIDNSNDVLITGAFISTIDLDPSSVVTNLVSSGNTDAFIAKMNVSGNLVWAKKFGGAMDNFNLGIVADSQKNIYSVGQFMGTVNFNPGAGTSNLTSTLSGSYYSFDISISKLDSNGNFVWAKKVGGIGDDSATAVTVDNSGKVYITGYFNNTVDFDPGSGVFNLSASGPSGTSDIYVLKLDSDGSFLWAKSFTSIGYNTAEAIKTDASGNIYFTGSFSNTVDFDPNSGVMQLTAAGDSGIPDAFVTKLDSNGNLLWAKSFSGTNFDNGKSLTIDSSNNVIVAGTFNGTVDFDPSSNVHNLTSQGGFDIFVAKLDTAGNFLWAKNFGGLSADNVSNLVVDASNNIYATGFFTGSADFNIGGDVAVLNASGDTDNTDAFILKLSPNGNFSWVKSIKGFKDQAGIAMAVDGLGNIYNGGYFTGTSNFQTENGVYENTSLNDSRDFYLLKLSLPLGVSENSKNEFKIFPNPSNGSFSISNIENLAGAKCIVFNLLGQKIEEFTLLTDQIKLHLEKGTYLLNIQKEGIQESRKIIIN
ncbi:T9SS type A sorting domain-containing protein [uncultured Flavobacterium sp.]|uniref:T9SS type A sorting domain-containing protein n=1 Tax=uncultured Flavobacterium sp. TaxID=165435 RepID=UPI0025E08CF5|nr:T9SS type A sorting domain-containing protein [uncultured Flavobacterium sp.]